MLRCHVIYGILFEMFLQWRSGATVDVQTSCGEGQLREFHLLRRQADDPGDVAIRSRYRG